LYFLKADSALLRQEGKFMKTESELYQLGRDVNGENHCFIERYTPGVSMTIVFPGYEAHGYRERFRSLYLTGQDYYVNAHAIVIRFQEGK
jgi:hypothetical protein